MKSVSFILDILNIGCVNIRRDEPDLQDGATQLYPVNHVHLVN